MKICVATVDINYNLFHITNMLLRTITLMTKVITTSLNTAIIRNINVIMNKYKKT